MKKITLLILTIVLCSTIAPAAVRYCRMCQVQNNRIVCNDTDGGGAWGCAIIMGLCQTVGTCFHGGCELGAQDTALALEDNPWIGSKELAADVERFSPTLHFIVGRSAYWVESHLDSPMELSINGGMTYDTHGLPVRFIRKRTGVNTWLFQVTEDELRYTVKITPAGWKISQGTALVSEGKF